METINQIIRYIGAINANAFVAIVYWISSNFAAFVSIACFVLSYLQFNEKGFLFNNAYIWASKQERKVMDKKPHYRQSGIVFLTLGIICAIITVDVVLKTGWIFYVVIVIAVIAIIYAIASSVIIEKNKK